MEEVVLEQTRTTPKIRFSPGSGQLEISGKSIPENATMFFEPLLKNLQSYMDSPQEETTVTINLDYFNTSTSRWIMLLFRRLVELSKREYKLIINWHYMKDDEESYETGENYEIILRRSSKKFYAEFIEFHYLAS